MYRDVFTVDTTPCKANQPSGPFQVPASFQGDNAEYRNLIRTRYSNDPHERKCMRMQAFWSGVDPSVTYVGPYADEARNIVKSLSVRVMNDLLHGGVTEQPKGQAA